MVTTYEITTPAMHDAREQAIKLAQAQGYRRISVLSVDQIRYGVYRITLQVS